MSKDSLSGLAQELVLQGCMESSTIVKAITEAKNESITLSQYLIKENLVSASIIAIINSELFGLPVFDITTLDPASQPKDLIPNKLISEHYAIPLLKSKDVLYIGISDPSNEGAVESFSFNSRLNVEAVLIPDDQLKVYIEKYLDGDGLGDFDSDDLLNLEDDSETPVENLGEDKHEDDGPVVKFVNKMLLTAIKTGASDLHFEPYEKMFRIRFRTDGILHEIARPPKGMSAKISSRLKIMSAMDISEKKRPQDGRIKLKLSKTTAIDFRVNTCPTLWGEKIVLRILDPSSAKMGIDALGYEPEQKSLFMNALSKPQGMILVTGPTGSGKTVSLYTGLNILNTVETNISTAEDPVEINLEGINQVNINHKQGMDFTQALRAFLRQDPDIKMVGKIRRSEEHTSELQSRPISRMPSSA